MQIGNSEYVENEITEKCYSENHLITIKTLIVPFLFIWVLLIMILIFLNILGGKNTVRKIKHLKIFWIMNADYDKKLYYW